jgi:uncharacterized protein
MNRRQMMMLPGLAFAARPGSTRGQQAQTAGGPNPARTVQNPRQNVLPDKMLLQDYRPKSIYKIPKTGIMKAKFPIIDVHCHARARTPEDVDHWIQTMDAVGVERTVVFSGGTGARFDEVHRLYSKYPDRFDVWCSFDLTGNDKPGFGPAAVKELERCHGMGAKGVGEITDKGRGLGGNIGTGPAGWKGRGGPASTGPHPDDPRMDSLFDRCGQLGMPVNIHVSDPIWAYEPMDNTNDGLMNAFTWRLDDKPDIMGHDGLIESLSRTARRHPKTVFIACHFANLDYDLTRLGQMFDRNPNLYADISARYAETAPIPRFAAKFYQKYQDRLLYGTDMAYTQQMFSATFRILESLDEHFYENGLNFNFNYHWPLHGFGLPDDVLKKVYRENALRAFQQARNNAA